MGDVNPLIGFGEELDANKEREKAKNSVKMGKLPALSKKRSEILKIPYRELGCRNKLLAFADYSAFPFLPTICFPRSKNSALSFVGS